MSETKWLESAPPEVEKDVLSLKYHNIRGTFDNHEVDSRYGHQNDIFLDGVVFIKDEIASV